MKHREFVYVGEPAPNLDGEQYKAFVLNFQKAVICSLKKRNLLSEAQSQRCIDELIKQNRKKQ